MTDRPLCDVDACNKVSKTRGLCGTHYERWRRHGVVGSAGLLREHHGMSETPLWFVWKGMIQRCHGVNASGYYKYGARGIVVCEEWRTLFTAFYAWAKDGYAPGLQIDRIDNDGPYAPDNCRWVTPAVNQRNTRRTHYVTAFGETKSLPDWAEDERCATSYRNLKLRLWRGWEPEVALTEPNRAAS